jgi:hypothetical protein
MWHDRTASAAPEGALFHASVYVSVSLCEQRGAEFTPFPCQFSSEILLCMLIAGEFAATKEAWGFAAC